MRGAGNEFPSDQPSKIVLAATEPQESKDAEYFQFLKAADDLIDQSRLGGYGAFLSPFSRQFKASIRETYPLEASAFEETDRNQEKAISDALLMRGITLCLFLTYSILIAALSIGYSPIDSNLVSDFEIVLPSAILLTLFSSLARHLFRRDYLSTIGGDATRFANYFFKALTRIHDQALNAVHLSTEDLMMTPSWPERSAGWIKIALWHSKRYENLDRYVTATAWKIESRYRQIERGFRALKIVVAVLVLALVGPSVISNAGSNPAGVAAISLYLLAASFFWGLRTQVSNAYWGQRFRESIVGFDAQKEHIHNQIAKVIAADKKYYMGGQRNVGKEKG